MLRGLALHCDTFIRAVMEGVVIHICIQYEFLNKIYF